jgi:putative permease
MIKSTPFYTRLAHISVSILCLGFLAIIGKTLLAPLIMAFLFAMLLIPFANFLEHRLKFPRALSSFAVLIVLVGIIFGIMVLLGSQLTEFTKDIPAFQQQLLTSFNSLQEWIEHSFHINNEQQTDYINTTAADAIGTGTVFIGATLLSLSTSLLFMVFIFLYTFFLLLHRRLLLRFAVALFHQNHSPVVYDVVNRIQYIIRKYIVGLLLQMVIVAALTCITFTIMGIKYAFLLGLLTGILNIIPYIGILISLLLSVLVTFATADPATVLFVAIALVVIHVIDGNYIMPKIVGSKVKLNTLTAVLGLVIGEMMWGITGMFLSIPVIAIAKVIFDRVEGLKPWGMVLGEDELEEAQEKVPAGEELPPLKSS